MIKSHDGNVTIEGEVVALLADVSCIANSMRDALNHLDKDIVYDLLVEAIRLGVYDDTAPAKEESIGCLLSEEQLKKILEDL